MINIGVVRQAPAKGMIAVEIESRFGDSTAHADGGARFARLEARMVAKLEGRWTASLQARLELAAPTDP
ncbi:MAG: hypothetical protein U1E20_00205 [Methylocystis sp.]|uniref:hypothetical protein n=1 Tax=Methylocystis sp. TaxID=1911079 RepID=UPI003940621C